MREQPPGGGQGDDPSQFKWRRRLGLQQATWSAPALACRITPCSRRRVGMGSARRCGRCGDSNRRTGMEIRQLLQTVRANWLVALVTFLLCLSSEGPTPCCRRRRTPRRLSCWPSHQQGATDPGTDVSAIQIEIPQITVEAENPTIDEEARAQLPARFQSVPVTIAATADPTTNSVTITASSTDPEAAQAFANATAARVVKVTNRDAGRTRTLRIGVGRTSDDADQPPRHGGRRGRDLRDHRRDLRGAGSGGSPTLRRGRRDLGAAGPPHFGPSAATPAPARTWPTCSSWHGDERGLEAFQQLRSHLYLMFQETHPVIAFTSCEPGEGKSCVASHTAWALATPGQFVVAVDGDLREPTLHEIFDVPVSPGVSDISMASGPSDLLAATGNRYLELIPAGIRATPRRHSGGGSSPAVACAPRVGSDGCSRLSPDHGGC